MPAHAYLEQVSVSQKKAFVKLSAKSTIFFHKAFFSHGIPCTLCYTLLRLILFLPVYYKLEPWC